MILFCVVVVFACSIDININIYIYFFFERSLVFVCKHNLLNSKCIHQQQKATKNVVDRKKRKNTTLFFLNI